jgi:hypothetical protein
MRLTDEAIATALIQRGSIVAAADELQCSKRTLYSRMKTPSFQELYSKAKAEVLRAAAAKLSNSVVDAVEVLTDVMNDPNCAAQVRINAASNVIQYAIKLTSTTDILERIAAIKEALNK